METTLFLYLTIVTVADVTSKKMVKKPLQMLTAPLLFYIYFTEAASASPAILFSLGCLVAANSFLVLQDEIKIPATLLFIGCFGYILFFASTDLSVRAMEITILLLSYPTAKVLLKIDRANLFVRSLLFSLILLSVAVFAAGAGYFVSVAGVLLIATGAAFQLVSDRKPLTPTTCFLIGNLLLVEGLML